MHGLKFLQSCTVCDKCSVAVGHAKNAAGIFAGFIGCCRITPGNKMQNIVPYPSVWW